MRHIPLLLLQNNRHVLRCQDEGEPGGDQSLRAAIHRERIRELPSLSPENFARNRWFVGVEC
jgi:hypothetical protein